MIIIFDQKGKSEVRRGFRFPRINEGVKIKTPTQNPKHLTQENSFPKSGLVTRK